MKKIRMRAHLNAVLYRFQEPLGLLITDVGDLVRLG